MSVNFDEYSEYYDLLYADKDYFSEVAYIKKLINTSASKKISSILELGCGTGVHACLMASEGVEVLGVDLSSDMLKIASKRASKVGSVSGSVNFEHGDARTYRANKKFDAVTSLFHVVSYQTTESDLLSLINTAFSHLEQGGLFIFDFWYGPAVLSKGPEVRVKNLENNSLKVTRIARPILHDDINVVDVNYLMYVHNKNNKKITVIEETHKMRYLFLVELSRLLNLVGFDIVKSEEWMTGMRPSLDSWSVCVVAYKK
jgi:SAM-dependent methyltransferase